jgi:hypothetical protein
LVTEAKETTSVTPTFFNSSKGFRFRGSLTVV